MRYPIVAALLLSGCSQQQANDAAPTANREVPSQAEPWNLAVEGDGAALTFAGTGGDVALRLFCPAGGRKLVVNVPGFTPIGSEERLSFGGGGDVVALVADPTGDEVRGVVTAEGAVPENLAQLLSAEVSANYGAQNSGPHAAPPESLANAFVGACTGQGSGAPAPGFSGVPGDNPAPAPYPMPAQSDASACRTGRDGNPVPANAIRAVGTEPFWGAKVEGRCVTYSHPENLAGTRVWTEFSGTASNGTWRGALNGQPFVMRTRPQPGCSDGMSDNRYPIAVSLTVNGEQRSGCAEPR